MFLPLARLTKEVPKDSQTYSMPTTKNGRNFFDLERRLAQDFAFMAAAEEGTLTRCPAACVERFGGLGNLTIRVASN